MVMNTIVTRLLGSFAPSSVKGMLVASAIGLAPTAAFAGHYDDFRFDVHIGSRGPAFEWRGPRPPGFLEIEMRGGGGPPFFPALGPRVGAGPRALPRVARHNPRAPPLRPP